MRRSDRSAMVTIGCGMTVLNASPARIFTLVIVPLIKIE
jgi:hypothetical protein